MTNPLPSAIGAAVLDEPDAISELAATLLDDELVVDPYGVVERLRPVLSGDAFSRLCDALDLCSVHVCDVEICLDDALPCRA